MTISTTASSVTVAGNGVTTSFNFSFIAGAASNIIVTYTDQYSNETVLTQGSQYTLSINAAAAGQIWGAGGTVTYPLTGSPIASGTYLTIERIVPFTQLISISNQGAFYPQVIEQAMDTLEMQIQQVEFQAERAIVINPADSALPNPLPIASVRAGQYLTFDSLGNPTTGAPVAGATVSTAMQPIVDAASIASAQTLFTGRQFATSAVTLYVNNVTGSDSNNGLSSATPFATIAHAVNVTCDQYVLSNQPFVIQLMTTGVTYNESVTLRPYVGSINVAPSTITTPVIQGNTSNNTSVTVGPTSGNGFTAVACQTPWCLSSFTLAVPNGAGAEMDWGSVLYHSNMNFGSCPNGSHLIAIYAGSKIEALRTSGYTISGGAQAHANAAVGGQIITQSSFGVITITGTPAFSSGFAVAATRAHIDYSSATFGGSATGPQCIIDDLSTILGPTNFIIGMGLPGSSYGGGVQANLSNMEKRALAGNANYSALFYQRIICFTVLLTAARQLTLALAADVNVGDIVHIVDGGTINNANTITVVCAGSDILTTGGTSYSLSTKGASTSLMSLGPGYWQRLT